MLVEGVTDYALYMLDPNGLVTTWNAGAERIKGYKASEILGKHFSVFYPAEALAGYIQLAEKDARSAVTRSIAVISRLPAAGSPR